jgi:hypothetical protein
LPFECAKLLLNSRIFIPGGQISEVADGPSGFDLTSYQNPYHSEPPDLLSLTIFYG